MNYKLIGATALSLMLATPAMAMHHGYRHYHTPRFGYSSVYGAYNFYPEDEFAPDNHSFDFDRRNTFN